MERRVGLRGGGQGWTDSQIITSLILLNLAGGESVMDLEVLEKDAGLCRVLRHAETHGMRRRERRALKARWRGERWRSVPSDSVVFRYLERFHDAGEEAKREAHRAFIPSPNDALKGLGKVNAGLVDFVQSRSPHTQATLDMDACLVESHKKEALYSYKKYRTYQPLTTYWAEADLVVHSEFRDGNVPAGHQQLRVLKEALGHLPVGVAKVMLRSDTAGYQQGLMTGHMTIEQAATLMGVSARHTRRILAAYRRDGAAAIAHGNRGHRPANATAETMATHVVVLARHTICRSQPHAPERVAEGARGHRHRS